MKFYKIEKCLIIELSALIMIPSFNFYEFRNLNLNKLRFHLNCGHIMTLYIRALFISCDSSRGKWQVCDDVT